MNIIICGAGRVGFTIAKLLSEQGHSITVIDQSSEDIQKINDSLDVKAIVGKATYPSILEKADGTNAEISLIADPSKSDDEKTYYVFNASAFTSQDKGDENWILTFSENNNYLDRTTYETKDADDPEDTFSYSLWNPNELPEAKDTEYPNPFVSTHTNNYVYEGEQEVGGIDCYKYSADETFAYSSESILGLKAAFDGFLPEGLDGTSAGEMQYKEMIWVGKETGQVADRALDIVVNW